MVERTQTGLKRLTVELLTTGLIAATLLGPATAQVAPAGGDPTNGTSASPTGDAGDLRTILPLLLTSPDRKRLALDLEAAIRTGDMRKAESNLNAAIEVGTLAIVLVDRLNDPNLVGALQGLGLRDDIPTPEPPIADKAAAAGSCAVTPAVEASNLADMQQALEQERTQSDRISQALASLTQERDALAERLDRETKSQATAASEMQQALQREQDQSRATIGELEKLQEEYRGLQAARERDQASEATSASERDALVSRERQRGDEAERRLADIQTELRDLRAFKDQRTASDATRVAELKKALAVAEWRGDMLTRELVDTEEELRTLQEPQRPSATPVVFRLAAAGTELPLAPVQDEASPPVVSQIGPASAIANKALPEATAALPKDLAPVVIAALPEAIQPLPAGAATLPPTKIEMPSVTEPKVSAPAAAPKSDDRLTSRAEELFHKGDVSGARLLFERAMDGGQARAAFLLAETYDPNVLSRLGVVGIRGDAAKAREYYARARALGVVQAGERLEALK
ncbi:hypothetical protein [Microvirga lotononidis]|uniref:Sel1 repeat protein n=1 Tax=Microvirga lotononidis TaxID=864069 RepID=I4YSM9_9HYPH|nr:hypothetical protein [Microvirga lotononidis]EIM26971.1 hypothetical protein MicloDRAFT_00035240 [Microvirga lotononidis]WQO28836.1 hypothetical protein U0023_07115 [Microvirga lotononidis]